MEPVRGPLRSARRWTNWGLTPLGKDVITQVAPSPRRRREHDYEAARREACVHRVKLEIVELDSDQPYKGRVPGVYDDWEDCRRQVHRFSGNSYKGYPTRVEAEGRYARYLAGEMRNMRRNRMKTMAFVMMLIVTMVIFYVIVV
ncbi:hypothetical protein QYE76_026095 [Lolium multiflorum]|uniref:Ribonuclease H1 N-terminal domain-containing protein n=1 Tax=Lolium multiflorum TaxID=4521 RepID=A0AAD8RJV6_LOLMU|nr:hypothetical protein QYE76_026095 [Lolium multiflorum]